MDNQNEKKMKSLRVMSARALLGLGGLTLASGGAEGARLRMLGELYMLQNMQPRAKPVQSQRTAVAAGTYGGMF